MQEPRYKPLSDEQLDELLEAFNELQVTDYRVAIMGQSGNMALEIRNPVIDPDSLGFILDVADRHGLKPYVFRTEPGGAESPLVLIPPRELVEPATPETTPTASAVMADESGELPEPASIADHDTLEEPADETLEDPSFEVAVFGDSVMISLPGHLTDDGGPSVSLAYEGIREQPIALEVAEAIGTRAAAAVKTGTVDPAPALAEAYEHGVDAFRRAVNSLAPAGEEPVVEEAVQLEAIPDS